MIEPTRHPDNRLTHRERAEKRHDMCVDVDDYIKEIILYCDDEEDLIALGSVLQILSKNILTSVMKKEDWRGIIGDYIRNVEQERDFGSIRKQYKDLI